MAASSSPKSTITTLSMPPQTAAQTSAPPVTKPAMSTESEDVKPSQKLLDQFMKEKFPTSAQGVPSSSSAGPSATFTSRSRFSHGGTHDVYARKLKKVKRAIKDAIFVNGAICDEVLRTEEKLAKAKEERRFLLRKLLQYQSVNEPIKTETQPTSKQQKGSQPGALSHDLSATEFGGKPAKAVKRKVPSASSSTTTASAAAHLAVPPGLTPGIGGVSGPGEPKKKHAAKDGSDAAHARPKKGKGANKKMIPPLMLDSQGRPIFPMALGDITLHSIGEIVPDRLSFHCAESIYPVGYCITRVYGSLHKLDTKCLYTCKISDNNDGPLFEIAAEDSSDIVFKSTSPLECHNSLIRAVNKSRGGNILPVEGRGLDFFGLSHPVIQNLIQSCPGARKCSRYKWVKFEINKQETNENVAVGTRDPAVSYEAFKAHLMTFGQKRVMVPSHLEQSTNLRSLLTKGNAPVS